MNPLTLVKRIQQINSKEAALGISEEASWHAKYKESAYVFVGGIPFDLTEGDLLAVFAQYGEIVDVNLVRDKATGKSKGFSFIAYEDQRSTNLAVDNLNGANVLGRTIRVDHVTNYKKKEEEDEEEEQKKREERGVCRAFQRGNCNRGAACKFSHNEQRSANTGWGPKDEGPSKWEQDKFEGPPKSNKTAGYKSSHRQPDPRGNNGILRFRSEDKKGRMSEPGDGEENMGRFDSRNGRNSRDQNRRGTEKWSERYEKEPSYKDSDRPTTEKKSARYESERNSTEDNDRRGRQESLRRHKEQDPKARHEISGKPESEPKSRGDRDNRGREERLGRHDSESRGDRDNRGREERLGRHGSESRGDHDIKGKEERLGRPDSKSNPKEDQQHKGGEKRSRNDRDSSYHHDGKEEDASNRRSRR